jgi:hypothetical protein
MKRHHLFRRVDGIKFRRVMFRSVHEIEVKGRPMACHRFGSTSPRLGGERCGHPCPAIDKPVSPLPSQGVGSQEHRDRRTKILRRESRSGPAGTDVALRHSVAEK